MLNLSIRVDDEPVELNEDEYDIFVGSLDDDDDDDEDEIVDVVESTELVAFNDEAPFGCLLCSSSVPPDDDDDDDDETGNSNNGDLDMYSSEKALFALLFSQLFELTPLSLLIIVEVLSPHKFIN